MKGTIIRVVNLLIRGDLMEARVKISYAKLLFIVVVSIVFFNVVNDTEKLSWIVSVFTPLLSAFAMAYLLDPMVEFLMRKTKLTRGWSILITCVVVVGLAAFVIVRGVPYLITSLKELLELIPGYFKSTYELIAKWKTMTDNQSILDGLDKMVDFMDYTQESFGSVMTEIAPSVLEKVVSYTMSIFSFVISFFMAVYMLMDKKDLFARIKRMIYAYREKEKADYIVFVIKEADKFFGKFLVGKFIDSVIIGVLCYIILMIVKMPNATLISIVVGITNMIPYFGPFMGGVPAVFITFIINPIQALWLALIIFILQQFDGIYLGPKILGDKVGVGPLWILVAVTLGGKLLGVLGMLLGVPFVALVKDLIESSVATRLEAKEMAALAMEDLNLKKDLGEKLKSKIKSKK